MDTQINFEDQGKMENIVEVYGEEYILLDCKDQSTAILSGGDISHTGHSFLVWPVAGRTYDFTKAVCPVWMGGKPYTTLACGESSSRDVKGKKITITAKRAGSGRAFARICYTE